VNNSKRSKPGQSEHTGSAALSRDDVIDVSRTPAYERTFVTTLGSVVGAAGIALLVPVVIILIGIPVALSVRGVAAATSWLLSLIGG
jgi:hypothetical protein